MTMFVVRSTPPSFSEVAGQVFKSVIAIAVGLRADSNEPNIESITDKDNVELILQERLAQMVVDSGLVNWLLKKIR